MTQKKKYRSYAEIDRDLEILKLEKDLHFEKMKLRFQQTKDNLSAPALVRGYFSLSTETKTGNLLINSLTKFGLPILTRWLKRKKTD